MKNPEEYQKGVTLTEMIDKQTTLKDMFIYLVWDSEDNVILKDNQLKVICWHREE